MAPEIMLSKGYTFSVDLWSAGICAYEFLCGGVPYAEDLDVTLSYFSEIISRILMKFMMR
jgi:cGMP-dependent protein kinase 1